ncbi:MAG: SpoIIIAH-like family protein [Eubacterium sp.]|nr:SpoIIIAH-like family protein [Eubacterium sp.]
MKKLLRKNQIIITALVVMVALAGYLSMTERDDLALTTANESVEDEAVADISEEDIVLDGDGSVSSASVAAVTGEDDNSEETMESSDVASRENAGEAVLVSNTVGSSFFEEAKLSREQTRAKNKETLTNLVNNTNVSDSQKDKAMNEIMKMTTISEKETATENLLAAKGFEEAVVTISENSVDVIVNAENLTEQQIAQIADVVKRKTECDADKIVISPVGKNK